MPSFMEIVEQTRSLLERNGRVSLRAVQREFDLDDEFVEDVADELSTIQQVAERAGQVLVWTGPSDHAASSTSVSTANQTANPTAESHEPTTTIAERRHLTVLFCDLVDSTRLGATMDPEDWRSVLRLYQQTATEVIEGLGGYTARFVGDGILAYFGHPHAHEDDPERAVRAGLGIVGRMSALNASLPARAGGITLEVRIGVDTGPVVVGTMGDGRTDIQALGDAPNLAARLQDEASPNSVVIGPATRRLVQGIFVTHHRGVRSLKGVRDRIPLVEVERVSGVRSRLDLLPPEDLFPLVGRASELALFEDRFDGALEGRGHAVLVNGEPGIGKSRLIHALRQRLEERPHSWLECCGSPYSTDSPFQPVLDLLGTALGFRAEAPVNTQIKALEVGLTASRFELEDTLPFVAELFGLPVDDRYAPSGLAPEGRRKRSLALLVDWVLRISESQPLVLLVEDLHWVDPSTLEWLGEVLTRIPRSQILMILTHRPDFAPPWPAQSGVSSMRLSSLSSAQIRDLVRKATGDRNLPSAWVDEIVRRSDGVPLYAEELIRRVLETEREAPTGPDVPSLEIPETLQDSLEARLDNLGPVKDLAQLCSVLGREFAYALLLQVSPLEEDALRIALDAAVREELFHLEGTPPDATYLFKHALIRDAAYQSMLRERRQDFHRRIAEILRDHWPALVDRHPERIAHHFAEAGRAEEAIDLFEKAATLARERSALREAELLLRRALTLLPDIKDPGHARELEIQDALAATAIATRGFASEELARILMRLESLVDAAPDHPSAPWALRKIVNVYLAQGDYARSNLAAREVIRSSKDLGLESLAHSGTGHLALVAGLGGDLAGALDLLATRGPFDVAAETRAAARLGSSGYLAHACYGSWFEFCLGRPESALSRADEAIERTRQIESPLSLSFHLTLAAFLRFYVRDYEGCLALAAEAGRVASENGFPLWDAVSALAAQASRTALGTLQSAEMFRAVKHSGQLGLGAGTPTIYWFGAGLERANDQIDEALETIDEALEQFSAIGQVYWHPELLRLRGEIEGNECGQPKAARTTLAKALETARQQGAQGLALRVATSWARLDVRDAAHAESALVRLESIYERFDEGHRRPDLLDAKAILDGRIETPEV